MGWHMVSRSMRTLNRLSNLKVGNLKRKGMHADGGGLYLRISDSGTKAWIFRFGENGKLHDMGLGPLHTISLAEAREMATDCRKLRLQGIDPILHRRASLAGRKASDAKAMTFRQCADAYMASHEDAWRNAIHRTQWRRSLVMHAYPLLGDLPVAVIDTPLVMKVIEPLWKGKTETASRVRGRIESILDWAKVRGFREGENPARWRGHLDHLLPARIRVKRVKHFAALPYAEAAEFMVALRQQSHIGARALEFTILTAARTEQTLGATWNEIDIGARVWTVPPERMKSGKEHRVPLSLPAVAVLKAMAAIRQSEFVFAGAGGGPIYPRAMAMALGRQGRENITVHGFRSTFRDWAAERTSFPREIAELALAHSVGSNVEQAYRRSDMFDKRRKLMDAWAEFCGKPAMGGKIVGIRGVS
jgi:integrase